MTSIYKIQLYSYKLVISKMKKIKEMTLLPSKKNKILWINLQKYLWINLTKELKNVYAGNNEYCLEKLKMTWINGKTFYVYELEN